MKVSFVACHRFGMPKEFKSGKNKELYYRITQVGAVRNDTENNFTGISIDIYISPKPLYTWLESLKVETKQIK